MAGYSVSFRLRRISTEYGYLSVPITEDLVIRLDDGSGRIDVEKMVQRAIEMRASPEVTWLPENQEIQPHPIQQAPEAE
jgi:hypothetical protein